MDNSIFFGIIKTEAMDVTMYLIELLTVPRLLFAQRPIISNYKNQFLNRRDFLEISYIEKGEIIRTTPSGVMHIAEQSLIGVCEDICCMQHSKTEQIHSTVGVRVQYRYKRIDCENLSAEYLQTIKKQIGEEGVFVIPSVLAAQEHQEILKQIQDIGSCYLIDDAYHRLLCLSKWFGLMAAVTNLCVRTLEDCVSAHPTSVYRYTDAVKSYIAANFNRKIKVSDIADTVSLSENYLHRVFKECTGMSILSYIQQTKIEAAKAYIAQYHPTEQETAEYVGIEDALYFSRLFKKVTGQTFLSYRKTH